MSHTYILTAFSHDRPGIVADITQVIYENNCNLEESAMANLAGEFALIFLFSPLSGDRGENLEEILTRECRRLERDKGITAFVRSVAPTPPNPELQEADAATIIVEGLDHAGIVYKISRFLADNQINISSLNSTVTSSPESGGAVYRMRIEVRIPSSIKREELERGLRRIGDELLVDIILE